MVTSLYYIKIHGEFMVMISKFCKEGIICVIIFFIKVNLFINTFWSRNRYQQPWNETKYGTCIWSWFPFGLIYMNFSNI